MKSALSAELASRGRDVLISCSFGLVHGLAFAATLADFGFVEIMVPNIDPEQDRKLAGWGLTQDDRARFVGWSRSLISRCFS